MTRPRIRPEAMIELRDAAEWYEEQQPGLGADLVDEFEETLKRSLDRFETSVAVARTAGGLPIRRFRLERFSRYAIYIVVVDSEPIVLAFEHSGREPGFWRSRGDDE